MVNNNQTIDYASLLRANKERLLSANSEAFANVCYKPYLSYCISISPQGDINTVYGTAENFDEITDNVPKDHFIMFVNDGTEKFWDILALIYYYGNNEQEIIEMVKNDLGNSGRFANFTMYLNTYNLPVWVAIGSYFPDLYEKYMAVAVPYFVNSRASEDMFESIVAEFE